MEIEAFHPEKVPVPCGTALPYVGGKICELRLFTQKKSLWPPAAEAPGAGAACCACTRSDPDFLGPSQGFFGVLPKDPLGSFPVRPPPEQWGCHGCTLPLVCAGHPSVAHPLLRPAGGCLSFPAVPKPPGSHPHAGTPTFSPPKSPPAARQGSAEPRPRSVQRSAPIHLMRRGWGRLY